MKKSTLIAIIALLISVIGVLIALVAYFKRRRCVICDDVDDEMLDDYFDYEGDELEEDEAEEPELDEPAQQTLENE